MDEMSLRRAIISHIRSRVPALATSTFQAFLAPSNPPNPYATVKMASVRLSPELNDAGDQTVEVRIHRTQSSYVDLDAVKNDVIRALHGATVLDAETALQYYVRWTSFGAGDFVEEDRKLIGCLVTFEVATIQERGA